MTVYHQQYSVNFPTEKSVARLCSTSEYPVPRKVSKGRKEYSVCLDGFLYAMVYLADDAHVSITLQHSVNKMQEG